MLRCSAPYSNPRSDRSGQQNTVFNRLGRSGGESGGGGGGGSGGGVFARLSGMSGTSKQSSWHKVTVSTFCFNCFALPSCTYQPDAF